MTQRLGLSRSSRSPHLDAAPSPTTSAESSIPTSADRGVVSAPSGKRVACASCPELFFPGYNERPTAKAVRVSAAKAVCAECPKASACREYARVNKLDGIWGGETDQERYEVGAGSPYAIALNKGDRVQQIKGATQVFAVSQANGQRDNRFCSLD